MTISTILPDLSNLGAVTTDPDTETVTVQTEKYGRLEVYVFEGQVRYFFYPAQRGVEGFSQTHSLNTFLHTVERTLDGGLRQPLEQVFVSLYGHRSVR
jgi:hypothetical protein